MTTTRNEKKTYCKTHPFESTLIERTLLSRPGSNKKTYHIRLSLSDSNITHRPGDTLAILPSNTQESVRELLSYISHDPLKTFIDPRSKQPITLEKFLTTKVNLHRVTSKLIDLLQLDTKHPDMETCLKAHGPFSGSLDAFAAACAPMLPRFYSIASSMHENPTSIDLLVATFTHPVGDKFVPGVGSHFLTTAELNTPVPLYHQPTKHFLLPSPETPIIMIGPGTGIAPYRAFLQERTATSAPGQNWLFFGEQQKNCDFYYEEELQKLVDNKNLILDTAFSRDQTEKIYVQHRLLEKSQEILNWINNGAHIYICGDAKRMAKDVLQTLAEITSPDQVKQMRKDKRLLLDVY